MTDSRNFPTQLDLSAQWGLKPNVMYLDHGAFGGTPIEILDAQEEIKRTIESDPHDFFERHYPSAIARSKAALARFISADQEGLVLTSGTTHALNVVIQSQSFNPGDQILITSHSYSSLKLIVERVALRDNAVVVVVYIPFPVHSATEILDAIVSKVTDKTKLAVIDHIPSRTALIFPIAKIVATLETLGVDTLVDGAHAPGMIPLNIRTINAPYYVGNCHKWMCAPRGTGFIHIREDRLDKIRPVIVARSPHAAQASKHNQLEHYFDWQGTFDPSAWLSLPSTIMFLENLIPGGHEELFRRNHHLTLEARNIICRKLQIEHVTPDELLGTMATIPLPDSIGDETAGMLPLQKALWREHKIQIPIYPWPAHPKRILRISVQAYNFLEQYICLADIVESYLKRETSLGHFPRQMNGILSKVNHACHDLTAALREQSCPDPHVRCPGSQKRALFRFPLRRRAIDDLETPTFDDLLPFAKLRIVDIVLKNRTDPPHLLYPNGQRTHETYFPLDDWLQFGNMEHEISRLVYTLSVYPVRRIPLQYSKEIETLLDQKSVLDSWLETVAEIKQKTMDLYRTLSAYPRSVNSFEDFAAITRDLFYRTPLHYPTDTSQTNLAVFLLQRTVGEVVNDLRQGSFYRLRQFLEIYSFLKDPISGLFKDFTGQRQLFVQLWREIEKDLAGLYISPKNQQAIAIQIAAESSYLSLHILTTVAYIHFRGYQQLPYVYVTLDHLDRAELSSPPRVLEILEEMLVTASDCGECRVAPVTIAYCYSFEFLKSRQVILDGNNRIVAIATLRFLACHGMTENYLQDMSTYCKKHDFDLRWFVELRDVLEEMRGRKGVTKLLECHEEALESFEDVTRIPALVVEEESFLTMSVLEAPGSVMQPATQAIFSEKSLQIALPPKSQTHGRPLGYKELPLL